MRIALNGWFWDQPNTGSGQYVRGLSDGLSLLYPEVEFLILYPGSTAPDGVARTRNVIPVTARVEGRGHLAKVVWEQFHAPSLAHRLGASLFHAPYWASPWRCSIPTVVTIHDLIPLLLPAYRGNALVRLYTALVRATATRAALVLTDSAASRQDIVRCLRLPGERVRAVHLAADPIHRPGPAPEDAPALAALGVAPGYLLYCGGFDVRKNLRTTLAAFAQARRAVPDARLLLVGRLPKSDSDFTPDPRRLARELGLPAEAVRYAGFVDEQTLPVLYRNARAMIFLSEYEGFGLTPLEAMACGAPVVGSHTSSLPEVVGDGGVLVAPADVESAAHAVIRLLTDDAFHAGMRERALRQASRFSWEATAKATWAAYESVLSYAGGSCGASD